MERIMIILPVDPASVVSVRHLSSTRRSTSLRIEMDLQAPCRARTLRLPIPHSSGLTLVSSVVCPVNMTLGRLFGGA